MVLFVMSCSRNSPAERSIDIVTELTAFDPNDRRSYGKMLNAEDPLRWQEIDWDLHKHFELLATRRLKESLPSEADSLGSGRERTARRNFTRWKSCRFVWNCSRLR